MAPQTGRTCDCPPSSFLGMIINLVRGTFPEGGKRMTKEIFFGTEGEHSIRLNLIYLTLVLLVPTLFTAGPLPSGITIAFNPGTPASFSSFRNYGKFFFYPTYVTLRTFFFFFPIVNTIFPGFLSF